MNHPAKVKAALVFLFIFISGVALSSFQSASAATPTSVRQQTNNGDDKKQQAMLKFLEAKRLHEQGDPKAITVLKEVIAMDPNDPEPHTELGKVYYEGRNYQDAEREAKEALKLDKDNEAANRLLGDIYFNDATVGNVVDKARANLALEKLEPVAKANRQDDTIWEKLAILYTGLGKHDKAIDALQVLANIHPGDPGPFLELAQQYYEDRKYSDAADNAKKAYDMIQPDQPQTARAKAQAFLLLTESLRQAGRTQEAADLINKDKEGKKSDSPAMKLFYAESYLSVGKNSEAEKALNEILAVDAKNAKALELKAEVLRRTGRRAEAAKTLQEALQGQDVDQSLVIISKLGEIQEEEEKTQDAIKTYDEALGYLTNPDGTIRDGNDDSASYFLRRIALVYRNSNDNTKEMATYDRMRKLLGPKNTFADVMVIDSLESSGKYDEALVKTRDAEKRFPDERSFKFLEAQLLGESGKSDEGVKLLKTMLNQKGKADDAGIYQEMATVHLNGNKLTEAESAANQALSLDPGNVGLLVTLSSVQEREKKFKESETALRNALKIDPNNATVLNNLGYFLTVRDDKKLLPEALELIQRAVSLEPTNGSFLDSLGWAYFQMGETTQAQKYLEQAIVYNHHSAEVNEHVGDLYKKLGRAEDAKKYWQKALTISHDPEQVTRLKGKLK